MTITLEVPPELEMPLQQAARLQGTDVPSILLRFAQQQLRREVLPESESRLLQLINTPLPKQIRAERDRLLAEQGEHELSSDDRERLISLMDTIEIANAERWRCIAELAQLRGLSLKEIAAQLELPIH